MRANSLPFICPKAKAGSCFKKAVECHAAIEANKQIRFKYYSYDIDKKKYYCFNYNVSKLSSKTISNYQKQLKYLQRYMAQAFQSKQLSYDGPLTGKVIVGIRPEQITFAPAGEGELTGVVKSHFYLGDVNDCRVDLGGGQEVRIIADPYESQGVKAGQTVSLKVRRYHAYPLDETNANFRKILT